MRPPTDRPLASLLRRPPSPTIRSALVMLASVVAGAALFIPTVAWTTSPLSLLSVTLSPTDVPLGRRTTGTVTISQTRVNSTIQLASQNTRIATVPTSMTIPAGQTSGAFTVRTSTSIPGCADIAATMGGITKRATIFVLPAPAPSGAPMRVTVPSSAVGGQTVQGRVGLLGVTAGTHTVQLSSSNTNVATVPASVTVSATQNEVTVSGSASFPITTTTVGHTQCAVITATFNGTTSKGLIKVVTISG